MNILFCLLPNSYECIIAIRPSMYITLYVLRNIEKSKSTPSSSRDAAPRGVTEYERKHQLNTVKNN